MATLTKEQYAQLKGQGRKNYIPQTTGQQTVITADKFIGELQGNASTASALDHAITLSLGGDASGSVQINANNARLDATIHDSEHANNADTAENAKHSAQASHADLANIATLALRSLLANNATHADRASNADNADHSDEATHAESADSASRATYDSNGDNIHNAFVNKQQQITNNTNLLSNHTTTIANHEQRITNNANRIEDLDTRVGNIETSTDIGRLTTRIVNIENKNLEQDGRLDAINDSMVTLTTAQYVSGIKRFNQSKVEMSNNPIGIDVTNKDYVDNKTLSSSQWVKDYTDNRILSSSNYVKEYTDNKILSTAKYVDDNFMSLTKSQYVTGLKTFNPLPQSENTPSNNKDLVTKAYVDSVVALVRSHCANHIGQLISATFPIDDSAEVYPANGAKLLGNGVYSSFVSVMRKKYNKGLKQLYAWNYQGHIIYTHEEEVTENTKLYNRDNSLYTDNAFLVTLVEPEVTEEQENIEEETPIQEAEISYEIRYKGHTCVSSPSFNIIVQTSKWFLSDKEIDFIQPILTSNGVLGGDTFAVSADAIFSSYYVYYPFSSVALSNQQSSWVKQANSASYTIYNPKPIRITSIQVTNRNESSPRSVRAGMVYGSNDNETWTELTTFTNDVLDGLAKWEIDLSSNISFFKYYRLDISNTNDSYIGFGKLDLIATYLLTKEEQFLASISQYGKCGKYIYDPIENSLRIPKCVGFVEGTVDDNEIGELTEAGLPQHTHNFSYLSAVSKNGNPDGSADTGGSGYWRYGNTWLSNTTDQAKSDKSIYGRNHTVQPESIKVYYYIIVGSSIKTEAEIDIDRVANDLNGKADLDLANVPDSKGVLVESYRNGSSWYRIYSDGYCEQGGMFVQSDWTDKTVTFLKEYIDTNYTLAFSGCGYTGQTYGLVIKAKTTTTFTAYGYNNTGLASWIACGYIR